ncbi:ABC transporter permease [Hyphomonas sp.]|uniref:ABC transporter permease n=1 Tax=Hyphomonas sp. TaxID=87 RepID=UPI003D26C199|tara:strand:+ start:10647 stop:11519 length:873 start_codon:yes stop_codon:yes gene_type:complete
MNNRSEQVGAATPVERVYAPDARYSATAVEAIVALFREIKNFRSHAAGMFISDFRSSYRGTVFGIFWNLVLPLVPLTVYIFLVNLRVFPVMEGLEPAIYIGFNVTVWSLMTGLVTGPIQVVKSRNKDSMKTSLPISVSVVSSFGQLCFDTLIRMVFLVLMVIYFQQWPHLNILGLVASLIVGIIFSMSMGLILSIFNVIIPDVSRVVTIMLQYGIFISGVIFPLSSMGPLVVLEQINPFAFIIKAARDYVFFGTHGDGVILLFWACVSFVMFFIAMRFFYIMERRIRGID